MIYKVLGVLCETKKRSVQRTFSDGCVRESTDIRDEGGQDVNSDATEGLI